MFGGLPGHGLGPASDFGLASGLQRVDRTSRQGIVLGVQPADGFLVVETRVLENRESSLEGLQDTVLSHEQGRYPPHAVVIADRNQLTLGDHGVDSGDLDVKGLGDVGDGGPVPDEIEYLGIVFVGTHVSRLDQTAADVLIRGPSPRIDGMKRTAPGPLTGRRLEGRYLLGDLIARGGMGVVYRGQDTRLARPVAVKVLKESIGSSEEAKDRFVHEAQAAAAIADPHVVAVWDQGVDASGPEPVVYLVMELVDGATLRDLIRQRSPMTVREALRVLVPLTQGLAAAHGHGLVHRDVKPENVLTSPEGSVKVTDFGLTRHVQAESATLSLVGSANYIAPELVRRRPAGKPADNYSVGIMLYEMLSGVPPFQGDSPYAVSMAHVDDDMPDLRRRFPDVDPEIVEIIAWCCAKEPENRPHDAEALHGELEHVLRRLPDESLDRRPPGYREVSTDLFSGLETASHTRAVQRAPVPPQRENPSVARWDSGDLDGLPVDDESSDAGTGPATTSVHAQRSLDDATRLMPEQAVGPVPGAAPSSSAGEAPSDPRVPTHVLGSAEPYRVWVWILVFVLAACMIAYLGWLTGVSFLPDQPSTLSWSDAVPSSPDPAHAA